MAKLTDLMPNSRDDSRHSDTFMLRFDQFGRLESFTNREQASVW